MRNSLLAVLLCALPLPASPRHPRHWYSPLRLTSQVQQTGSDLVHPQRDWFWSTSAYALLLAYGADQASSKYVADRCYLCAESGPFIRGTHSTWNVALVWLAIDGSALVASDWVDHTRASPLSAATAWLSVAHAQNAYHNAGICSRPDICK